MNNRSMTKASVSKLVHFQYQGNTVKDWFLDCLVS